MPGQQVTTDHLSPDGGTGPSVFASSYFSRYSWLVIALTLLACTRSSDKTAPERNFYFEVIANQKNDSLRRLAAFITHQITGKKYTITNHSGREWPFYRTLQTDEEISRDSLMPPHWFVHHMVPLDARQTIRMDEFVVRIFLLPKPDTLPNYAVEIYRMDSTGLTLSGETGIHFIDSTEFSPPETLREHYLKSILRYSFK